MLIEINGSYGEGGGQILRTSLSLSCVTGKPVRISDIRAGRREPGLRPQHLLSANAAASIAGGRLEGADIGSKVLSFEPERTKPGKYIFDVSEDMASAGSTGLVFQTIAPPLFFTEKESRVSIKGGTHVEWAPPADYISGVFLPVLSSMGVHAELKNPLAGYYPIGGGMIEAHISPASGTPLKPLVAIKRGMLLRLSVISKVSNLPFHIAERQIKRVKERLMGYFKDIPEPVEVCSTAPSPGRGSYVFILAEFENIRAGFSALGAPGKKAEAVADEAADKFLRYMGRTGALDPHLADQVLVFMALAGGESAITATEVTGHIKANIYAIEKFLPVKFIVEEETGGEGKITVKGCGHIPR